MTKSSAKNNSLYLINDEEVQIGQWKRTEDINNSDKQVYYLKKSHIISPWDEFIDLTDEEKQEALNLTNKLRKKLGPANFPSGHIVRNEMRSPQKPLLLIYLLDPEESLGESSSLPKGTNPFVGYAISFPKSEYNVPVSYAINEELLDRFDIVEDDFEDYGDYENDEN